MKQPWLVQRCILKEGKLRYEYMGSSEFEFGDQAQAPKRIFATGMEMSLVTISIGGKEIPVYMVASKGFLFIDYQVYLQQMAEGRLMSLKEQTDFDDVVKTKIGLHTDFGHMIRTNVWFDFENDVLWTLTEDNRKALVAVLKKIEESWTHVK